MAGQVVPTFHLFLRPTDQELITYYLESKILHEYNPVHEQIRAIGDPNSEEPCNIFHGSVLISTSICEEQQLHKHSEHRLFYTFKNAVRGHEEGTVGLNKSMGGWLKIPSLAAGHSHILNSQGELIGFKTQYNFCADLFGHVPWTMEEYSVAGDLAQRLKNECIHKGLPSSSLNWRIVILIKLPPLNFWMWPLLESNKENDPLLATTPLRDLQPNLTLAL